MVSLAPRSLAFLLLSACALPELEPAGKTCSLVDPCPTGYLCESSGDSERCQPGIAFQDGVAPTAAWEGTSAVTIAASAPRENFVEETSVEVDGEEPSGSGHGRSGLLRWQVEGLPPGARLRAVRVTLDFINASGGESHGVHLLERAWSEREVTWAQAARDVPWAGPGATSSSDRGGQVVRISPGELGPYTFDLDAAGVARVQQWVDSPASNFGMVLVGEASNGSLFESQRAAIPAVRPRLTLLY